ncbi:MAG: hypothetical protein E7011_02150 [Alphaproteobacteria bacterium]|nr:hypothetical protein [Alphaproteobacteria bacterium]
MNNIGGVIVNRFHPNFRTFYDKFEDARQAYKTMAQPFQKFWYLLPWIKDVKGGTSVRTN